VTGGRLTLLEEIRKVAGELPLPLAESLAETIQTLTSPEAASVPAAVCA